jgi:hypothetical protein
VAMSDNRCTYTGREWDKDTTTGLIILSYDACWDDLNVLEGRDGSEYVLNVGSIAKC